MAMGFSDKSAKKMFERYFKPAVANAGFELRRLDEKPRAGSIMNRLRVEIRKSRFLIADLTNNNSGAYWEAGFADGLGKPVIYTCESNSFGIPGRTSTLSRNTPSDGASPNRTLR